MTPRRTVTAGLAAVLLATACTTADDAVEQAPTEQEPTREPITADPTPPAASPSATGDDDPGGESVGVQDDVTIVVEETRPGPT